MTAAGHPVDRRSAPLSTASYSCQVRAALAMLISVGPVTVPPSRDICLSGEIRAVGAPHGAVSTELVGPVEVDRAGRRDAMFLAGPRDGYLVLYMARPRPWLEPDPPLFAQGERALRRRAGRRESERRIERRKGEVKGGAR